MSMWFVFWLSLVYAFMLFVYAHAKSCVVHSASPLEPGCDILSKYEYDLIPNPNLFSSYKHQSEQITIIYNYCKIIIQFWGVIKVNSTLTWSCIYVEFYCIYICVCSLEQ